MVTPNAETIFNEFQRLRDENSSQTAEERLESYCRDVLTTVERLHFDYKTKRDPRKPQLEDDDKKNLAKAVSGFANTSGGVLLWGIKGSPIPTLTPITQIETFMAKLLELAGLATEPSVFGIDGVWIPAKNDPTAGFGAILVPESSLPPHRVALKIKDVQNHYYMRTGSNFIIAPHVILEDMFGRRPRPDLIPVVRSDFPYDPIESMWHINFDVMNRGRSMATRMGIEFLSNSHEQQEGGDIYWRPVNTCDPATGDRKVLFELIPTLVIHPGMAIPFDGLRLRSQAYVPGQFVQLACTFYCEGCAPVNTSIDGTLQPIRSV